LSHSVSPIVCWALLRLGLMNYLPKLASKLIKILLIFAS
jgi:hypothetical protein